MTGRDASTPVRVLCVDDNLMVVDAVRRLVERTPGMVWAGGVYDANNLLPTAGESKPDVVLLDIDLPGMDAFSAIRLLQDEHSSARVIVMSGHVRKDLVDRAFEAGAWGYLSKTSASDNLADAILRVASGGIALSPDAEAVLGQ
jgi:DNA-binding NarL/FixJ family response regulator